MVWLCWHLQWLTALFEGESLAVSVSSYNVGPACHIVTSMTFSKAKTLLKAKQWRWYATGGYQREHPPTGKGQGSAQDCWSAYQIQANNAILHYFMVTFNGFLGWVVAV
jgi:hypothetical protein